MKAFISASCYHQQIENGFYSNSPQQQRQLLLLSALRALSSIAGGDRKFMQHWMVTHNNSLKGEPLQLIATPDGLGKVEKYLVAMKNKT